MSPKLVLGENIAQATQFVTNGAAQAGMHAASLQVALRPGNGKEAVELGKTDFGLLAVRVAKSLSVHFGGGRITDSEGRIDEARGYYGECINVCRDIGDRPGIAQVLEASGAIAHADGDDENGARLLAAERRRRSALVFLERHRTFAVPAATLVYESGPDHFCASLLIS